MNTHEGEPKRDLTTLSVKELVERVRKHGDSAAEDLLCRRYLPLVKHYVDFPADYPPEWRDAQALESDLNAAVFEAVRRYDPDNEQHCSLESYVTQYLKCRRSDYLRNQKRRERHCKRGHEAADIVDARRGEHYPSGRHDDVPLVSHDDPARIVEHDDFLARLDDVAAHLTTMQYDAYRGLQEGESMRQFARRLDITDRQARQVYGRLAHVLFVTAHGVPIDPWLAGLVTYTYDARRL